jgi:hypothetical protein
LAAAIICAVATRPLVAPLTVEMILVVLFTVVLIFADVAEFLVTLVTNNHILALETQRLVAFFTGESVFTLRTEFPLAYCAVHKGFTTVAECLVGPGTARPIVAHFKGDGISFALEMRPLQAHFTVERHHVIAVGAEMFRAFVTDLRTIALETIQTFASFTNDVVFVVFVFAVDAEMCIALLTMAGIFAVVAECLLALGTVERIVAERTI